MLERTESRVPRYVDHDPVSERRQDLDQSLRMLIGARARGVRRLNLRIVDLRRHDRRRASWWPEPEMDHLRRHFRMADERRMQLRCEVATRSDRVDREDVRACPSARRLAQRRLAVNPQLQVDTWTRNHTYDATARASCRQLLRKRIKDRLASRLPGASTSALSRRPPETAASTWWLLRRLCRSRVRRGQRSRECSAN